VTVGTVAIMEEVGVDREHVGVMADVGQERFTLT
jgi:hypothetical protein